MNNVTRTILIVIALWQGVIVSKLPVKELAVNGLTVSELNSSGLTSNADSKTSQERKKGQKKKKDTSKKLASKKPASKRLASQLKEELAYLAKNRGPFKIFSQASFTSGALSPNGRFYALGSKEGALHIGDALSGKEGQLVPAHKRPVAWIAFSPDGTLILTCSVDATAKLWKRDSGALLHTLSEHKAPLFTGSFSSDGNRVLTGSSDGTVKVWDVKTGKKITGFPLGFAVDAVSFCDEGETICSTALNGRTKQWDQASGEELCSVRGPQGPLAVSEFSPDGNKIFSGTYVGTIIAWDPVSGKTIKTLFLGEQIKIFALALSKNGAKLLAGCSDGTARFFDVRSRKECMRLLGNKAGILSVALSGPSDRALTISSQGEAFLYDLSMGPLKRLQSSLTAQKVAFLKDAYAARKKGSPLILTTPAEYELLLSFEEPLISLLKGAFRLGVNKESEQTALEAHKEFLE